MIRGFSLIEILLVVGMLIIIGAVSLSTYTGYRSTIEADEEASRIRSMLRSAQGRAIGFEGNSKWGVHFSNPSSGSPTYELFQGSSYPGTIQETVYLSPRFVFTAPSTGGTEDVIFEKRSGKTTAGSEITIRFKPTSSATPVKTVTITPEGKIE